jgi:hypothetical protein
VAALAPCAQVFVVAMFRRVIKVRYGQNYLGSSEDHVGNFPRAIIVTNNKFSIRNSAFFASIACALAYPQADGWPVFRITVFVFWPDRHQRVVT